MRWSMVRASEPYYELARFTRTYHRPSHYALALALALLTRTLHSHRPSTIALCIARALALCTRTVHSH
eukprot:1184748-Prorocentrum_minimum.AAC.2